MLRLNPQLSLKQVACLAALADGIIPPDEKDAGAGSVNAAARLAEKIGNGINSSLYFEGLLIAASLASERHSREVGQLNAQEIHDLLGAIRERAPGFFKQLRMDVSALYLSDPAVWQRIGFPGPSIATGGYLDFDQPQKK